MRFGFLITARCNAACAHCTVSSGPHRTEALAPDHVRSLMDQAAGIWRRERAAGEGLDFSLSGGEPFLDFPRLLDLVRHGTRLGARMACVTNGYWATGEPRARARLDALREAGLVRLAVSTSRFHQRFVRRGRVERALALAREAGIRTTLKCVYSASDAAPMGRWARRTRTDQRELFPVLPYLRDGESLPEAEYIRRRALPAGRCPAATLTVREDGAAYTCCMPGAFNNFLRVGDTRQEPLEALHERFYLQPRQRALRARGPKLFARAAIEAGLGHRLRPRYEGVCDLCAHVTSDAALSAIADAAAGEFAAREFATEARKHRRTALSITPAPTPGG